MLHLNVQKQAIHVQKSSTNISVKFHAFVLKTKREINIFSAQPFFGLVLSISLYEWQEVLRDTEYEVKSLICSFEHPQQYSWSVSYFTAAKLPSYITVSI